MRCISLVVMEMVVDLHNYSWTFVIDKVWSKVRLSRIDVSRSSSQSTTCFYLDLH
jgi:hypothetical protein